MSAINETVADVLEQSLAGARLQSPIRAVGVAGSPRAPSKSKTLAERFLAALQRLGCETRLIDVATLPAEALVVRETSADIDDALGAVGQAQIIVASTPTYRATYTGVLKCFFDLMPQGHLAGKVCVGLQTGIASAHALSPEYGLRPLFASLEGLPVLTIYATDAEFDSGEPNAELSERIHRAAEQAVQVAHGLSSGEA
ncbi:MAG: NAD(P)H-dependent oxidoreductase [Chloroflexota bacterium]